MSCEICGRGSCTRSFHSIEAQEEFDERQSMSDDVGTLREELQSARAELAALRKDYERERTNNAALQAQVNAFYAGNPQGGIVQRLEAELAALRAERDDNERGWQRTYNIDVGLLKARAERAEAEAARLLGLIEQAPHKLTCDWWGNKLDDIAGPDGKTRNCNCWKRAALAQEGGR